VRACVGELGVVGSFVDLVVRVAEACSDDTDQDLVSLGYGGGYFLELVILVELASRQSYATPNADFTEDDQRC
jgi:hypothetical protein